MKNFSILFLMLFCATLFAQQQKTSLKGKLTGPDDLEGIYVINRTTETTITTSRGGYFAIDAAVGDTIIFSAVTIVAKEIIVKPEDFGDSLVFIPVERYVHELAELVIVDYSYINAESLGLVPKGQIQRTISEKRVYTATNGVDAVFNMFSGRTRMLEKAAETAAKEQLMEKINYIYTEDELVEQFNIPRDYVRGFVFFAVEDANFARALREKGNEMAKFLMKSVSARYLELINQQ